MSGRALAPLTRADWMPRKRSSLPSLRVGGRRELLRIAAAMLTRAVQDLGANRVEHGGGLLARHWAALATMVMALSRVFDFDATAFRPTIDELSTWLVEVTALRQILRQPAQLDPLELRLDQLLAQFGEVDWTDVTAWQRSFRARRGY